ncbi:MAG: hypothetical protein JWM22_2028 [Frankiales bacterium]|jgi:hypothetical protein|nr:hypothetical protein [Frankiales bacterium]
MSERHTLAHFLHDAGLAAWFGGSLMGAVGLNGAAAQVDDPGQRARTASAGWARWTPFNAAAIGAHLLGGALLLKDNKGRVKKQKGVLANTNTKLFLTAGALGATAYSRYLGQKVIAAGAVPVEGATEPNALTPPEVAKAQKQLKALQWAIPGLTGAVLASSALHEEQQKPSQVLRGTVRGAGARAAEVAGPIAALAGARALTAAHSAGPALERARDAAVPALEKARASAGPAVAKAAERAKEVLPV